MIQYLLQIDYAILRLINVQLGSTHLDHFWMVVTHLDRYWLARAVAAALVFWGFYIYEWRFFRVVLVLVFAVSLSDLFCYRVVKQFVHRPRPFQNPEISQWLRPVGDAHGPSFPSNHAANVMAGAVVLATYFERRRYLFYSFAGLVAFSRCALGVHYPSDVVSGCLIGLIISSVICGICLGIFYDAFALVEIGNSRSGEVSGWRTRVRRLRKRRRKK